MRLAKARKSRKHLNFYRATHGFRPPFTVLIDGTALQTALNLGIVLKDELAKLLGGRAEVVVSRAVRCSGVLYGAAGCVAPRATSNQIGGGICGGLVPLRRPPRTPALRYHRSGRGRGAGETRSPAG